MSLVVLLTVVCAVTYTFEIVFGLAGTIIMITVMSNFMDAKTLVIYSILPQILAGSIGLLRSPKTVELKVLGKMVLFAAFGALGGLYVFSTMSSDYFQVALASAITLFGTYLVAAPGRLRLSPLAGRSLDTVAGASQALFGISGPIAMTRLLSTFEEKIVIRNYALAFFLSMNVFRGGWYAIDGTISEEVLRMMWISAPVLFIVLWFANHLHYKVNERYFKRIIAWIILLGGISLFFNGPSSG